MGRALGNPRSSRAELQPAPTSQAGLAPCFWTSPWLELGLWSAPFLDFYWLSANGILSSQVCWQCTPTESLTGVAEKVFTSRELPTA